MDFKVIRVDDKKAWNHTLSKMQLFDFYHTAFYHNLDISGDPCLLVFEDHGISQALPIIIRKIPGTNWKDVTSVYGYAGWLRSSPYNLANVSDILNDFFKKENIISAFSRIHPLIEGAGDFNCGELVQMGITKAIDLHLPPEVQFSSYSESVRRFIKNKKKEGLTVRYARSKEDIEHFYQIYKDAMTRLNASFHYHFSLTYIKSLLESKDFRSFVLLSEFNGHITGGGLFVICNQIMQYHLGAIKEEYRFLSPLKMIIDTARIIGNDEKISILHLGGGYGGENDNLLVFKSRMSTLTFPFKVWKWIVDENIYNELTQGKLNSSFFPLYRS